MKYIPTMMLVATLSLVAAGSLVAQENVSMLPGGASSLQETYQDWRLNCRSEAASTICAVEQVQNQQNGQRLMAIEIRRDGSDALMGTLLLPFGLKLNAGVMSQIDEEALSEPWEFSTCMLAGCIVPLKFDAAMVSALRNGIVLHLKTQSIDARAVNLTVPLKGFSLALDRMQMLVN
ncbi:invasion associated locus B family protein [Roseibium sp. M-1]